MYIYFPKGDAYVFPGPYLGYTMNYDTNSLKKSNKFEKEYIKEGVFIIKFKYEFDNDEGSNEEKYLYLAVELDIIYPSQNKHTALRFYDNDKYLDAGDGWALTLDTKSPYLATLFCQKLSEENNDDFICILGE